MKYVGKDRDPIFFMLVDQGLIVVLKNKCQYSFMCIYDPCDYKKQSLDKYLL